MITQSQTRCLALILFGSHQEYYTSYMSASFVVRYSTRFKNGTYNRLSSTPRDRDRKKTVNIMMILIKKKEDGRKKEGPLAMWTGFPAMDSISHSGLTCNGKCNVEIIA